MGPAVDKAKAKDFYKKPTPGEAVTPCTGSPRFLDWLAKHNRAQTDLDVSNRVLGRDKRDNARHGVDCACVSPAGSPESQQVTEKLL